MSRLKEPYFDVVSVLELMLWSILKKYLMVAYENNKVVFVALAAAFAPALPFIFVPGVQVLVGHQETLIWHSILIVASILPLPFLWYVFLQNRKYLHQIYPTRQQLSLCFILLYIKRYLVFWLLWFLPFIVTWSETNIYYPEYFSSLFVVVALVLLVAMAISVHLLSFQHVYSISIRAFNYSITGSSGLLLAQNWQWVLLRSTVLVSAIYLFESNDIANVSVAILLTSVLWALSINSDVKLLKDFAFFTHLTGHSNFYLRWMSMLPADLSCFAISVVGYSIIWDGAKESLPFTAAYLTGSYIIAFALAQQWREITMPTLIVLTGIYAGMQLSLIS